MYRVADINVVVTMSGSEGGADGAGDHTALFVSKLARFFFVEVRMVETGRARVTAPGCTFH